MIYIRESKGVEFLEVGYKVKYLLCIQELYDARRKKAPTRNSRSKVGNLRRPPNDLRHSIIKIALRHISGPDTTHVYPPGSIRPGIEIQACSAQ